MQTALWASSPQSLGILPQAPAAPGVCQQGRAVGNALPAECTGDIFPPALEDVKPDCIGMCFNVYDLMGMPAFAVLEEFSAIFSTTLSCRSCRFGDKKLLMDLLALLHRNIHYSQCFFIKAQECF